MIRLASKWKNFLLLLSTLVCVLFSYGFIGGFSGGRAYLKELSTAPAARNGFVVLYALSADGKPYSVEDDGTRTDITAGTGGGVAQNQTGVSIWEVGTGGTETGVSNIGIKAGTNITITESYSVGGTYVIELASTLVGGAVSLATLTTYTNFDTGVTAMTWKCSNGGVTWFETSPNVTAFAMSSDGTWWFVDPITGDTNYGSGNSIYLTNANIVGGVTSPHISGNSIYAALLNIGAVGPGVEAILEAVLDHDDLQGFVANEHLDWTASVGTIHTGNYIENPFGAMIDDTELTAEDFGDFTSDGGEDGCTLDAGVVGTSEMADGSILIADINTASGPELQSGVTKWMDITVTDPDDLRVIGTNRYIELLLVNKERYPNGILINYLAIEQKSGVTTYTVELEEWDTNDAAAFSSLVESITSTTGKFEIGGSNIDDQNIAVGGRLYLDLVDADETDQVHVVVGFQIK